MDEIIGLGGHEQVGGREALMIGMLQPLWIE